MEYVVQLRGTPMSRDHQCDDAELVEYLSACSPVAPPRLDSINYTRDGFIRQPWKARE